MDDTSFQGIDDTSFQVSILPEKCYPCLPTDLSPMSPDRTPSDVLDRVQTLRALENFPISQLRIHPALTTAYAEIKKAAAETNMQTGNLEPELGWAMVHAADEVISARWHDQFDLDVFHAGAGTFYNMNTNEVIANRALGRLRASGEALLEVPLGGTAVGTGTNTHSEYARLAIERLGRITGCARLIRAHPDRCREYAERSVGNAALHNEELGFMGASQLAKRAIETGKALMSWLRRVGKLKPERARVSIRLVERIRIGMGNAS
jgi:aspartate ammonia-lyase